MPLHRRMGAQVSASLRTSGLLLGAQKSPGPSSAVHETLLRP
ncbi:hypothetical protein M3J09_008126 [Ascochyta lentis]